MCFSATASFTAAAVVGGLGAATLPLVRDRREVVFAALPLLFAAHQFIEGVIWQQVERSGDVSLRSPAVIAWLFVAWFLLPTWLPLSVRRFESDPRRRRWMLALAGLGAAIGSYLYAASFLLSATVTVNEHHLQYQLPLRPGWLLALPYVVATCLPLLLSTRRYVNQFGVVMLVSMTASAVIAAREFSSVWCFFAALMSLGLLLHYAFERRESQSVSLVSG